MLSSLVFGRISGSEGEGKSLGGRAEGSGGIVRSGAARPFETGGSIVQGRNVHRHEVNVKIDWRWNQRLIETERHAIDSWHVAD